jgi:hypothetical protein
MGMGGQRMIGARSGYDAAGTSHGRAARDHSPAPPRTLELPLARSSALQARPDWRKHAHAARNARSPSCAAASASCESSRRAVASSTAVGGGRPAAPVGRRAGHFMAPQQEGLACEPFVPACGSERGRGIGSRRRGPVGCGPDRSRTRGRRARQRVGWVGGLRRPMHSLMHCNCSRASGLCPSTKSRGWAALTGRVLIPFGIKGYEEIEQNWPQIKPDQAGCSSALVWWPLVAPQSSNPSNLLQTSDPSAPAVVGLSA